MSPNRLRPRRLRASPVMRWRPRGGLKRTPVSVGHLRRALADDPVACLGQAHRARQHAALVGGLDRACRLPVARRAQVVAVGEARIVERQVEIGGIAARRGEADIAAAGHRAVAGRGGQLLDLEPVAR